MHNRNVLIDTARGIAVCLIVAGHVLLGADRLKDFLYCFHINLFFMLGGFLASISMQHVSFAKFVRKKIDRLIVPYFAFWVLYFLNSFIINALALHIDKTYPFKNSIMYLQLMLKPVQSNFNDIVFSFIMSNDYYIAKTGVHGFFWFFPAYFLATVMFYFIVKIKAPGVLQQCMIVFFCCLAAFSLNSFLNHNSIPWGIDIALLNLALMWFGMLIMRKMQVFVNMQQRHDLILKVFILMILLALFCGSLKTGVALHLFKIPNVAVYYAFAVAGFLMVLLLAMYLANTPAKKILTIIGQYSISIICLHIIIRDYCWLVLIPLYNRLLLDGFILQIISLLFQIITLVSCILLPVVISRGVVKCIKSFGGFSFGKASL